MPILQQGLPASGSTTAMYYNPDFPLMFGGTGAWQVFRYDTVLQVLSDYRSFSNSYMPKGEGYLIGSNLNQTDPPMHATLRNVVAGPFKREAIREREPLIQSRCGRVLERVMAKGVIDFVHDFAYPISTAVICDIMGIPEGVHEKVGAWSKSIVTAGYSPGGLEQAQVAQAEMAAFFYALLQERNNTPKEDVLSLLAAAKIEGAPLPIDIQAGSCMTILLAGHQTTADYLANALYLFLTVPGLWKQLQENPVFLPGALSEVLRLRPSIVSMYRVAVEDTELEGQLIRSGELVNAWINAANSDPEVFEKPETFNPGRGNFAKVLSYGKGIHHCLGEHLARTEALLAFELLLSKMEDVQIMAAPKALPSAIVNGFEHFPVVLTAKP